MSTYTPHIEGQTCGPIQPCAACLTKYGPVLLKCSCDIWPVVVGLKGGASFIASECDIAGDWVTFRETQGYSSDFYPPFEERPQHLLDGLQGRGVCVALSEIAWVVDTGH